ncbi:MAG: DUF2934 domain-containing protein [Vicinamibacterales bacterium]
MKRTSRTAAPYRDAVPVAPSAADRPLHDEIARRAYARFCERGCCHGADLDDWLAAEREVLAEHQDQP